MIIFSHNFIRDNYDISYVSLRDVKRFNILYEFFYNYLKNKKENLLNLITTENDKLAEFDFQIYSINLSIYICYYLKISTRYLRQIYIEKINQIFKYRNFIEFPQIEEKFLIDNMEILKDIKINCSMLQNIFSLFCAINTNIPIFIYENTDTNKLFCFKIIYNSMKGYWSNNSFFKLFPKIILFSYNDLLNNNLEEKNDIFKKVNNIYDRLNEIEKKENIFVIYFNEKEINRHINLLNNIEIYFPNSENKNISFAVLSNKIVDELEINKYLFILNKD